MDICKISNVRWNVGSHLSFSRCIAPTFSQAIKLGMYTFQFFMGNPKNAWIRQQISEQDIQNCLVLMNRFPMNIFSHYPYCANLAGKAELNGLAWSGNNNIDKKLLAVIESLEYELSILASFQQSHLNIRSGVVIHPGSYPNRIAGHKSVAKTLNRVNFPEKSVLLLENCAGEGNKLCRTFQEIHDVMILLDENIKPHVKVCVDTAHIWGQGDYDLRKLDEIDRLFSDFENLVGIDNFYLLHLNDSSAQFGSKKDAHAHLGTGYIWGENFRSLIYLLDKCNYYHIPMVLETSAYDMLTLSSI